MKEKDFEAALTQLISDFRSIPGLRPRLQAFLAGDREVAKSITESLKVHYSGKDAAELTIALFDALIVEEI